MIQKCTAKCTSKEPDWNVRPDISVHFDAKMTPDDHFAKMIPDDLLTLTNGLI